MLPNNIIMLLPNFLIIINTFYLSKKDHYNNKLKISLVFHHGIKVK